MFPKIKLKQIVACGMVCLWALGSAATAKNSSPETAAKGFQRLFNFDKTNGVGPIGIVQGTDGNFYGVTPSGGTNNNDLVCGQNVGCGTVFKISSSGDLTTIYNFCALQNCADGALPLTTLVLDTDGNFYGQTWFGGAITNKSCPSSCGTLFRITPAGDLTTLYNFCTEGGCLDGLNPDGLALGIDGNLYGTTFAGGANATCKGGGCGTVFQFTPAGKLTTLYSFCSQASCADGGQPNPVLQASDGNLYGTTQVDGAHAGGTIFKLSTAGAFTTLYSFCSQPNCADGAGPTAGLVQASDSNFYGTAEFGGGSQDEGTIFRITPTGNYTTLFTFCQQSSCPTGGAPGAALIQATDGNFFGTDIAGAGNCFIEVACGAIFGITPAGKEKTIYAYCFSQTSCEDARDPGFGLVQGTDGNFYGTTLLGGNNAICVPYGCGSFYRVNTGLEPFVGFVNRAGSVDTQVGIIGQGFESASGVSFNGVTAQFTIRSNTFITATVPTGATSGSVTVTTTQGNLKSNVAFQVLP
jgi:uncharacterized repeat protein (TIGR03803 family)